MICGISARCSTCSMKRATADSPYYSQSARDWVENLRRLPLGQADLAEVRAQMVGYILALMEWSEGPDAALEIEGLKVSAVEADGSATVRWHTSARADSDVRIGARSRALRCAGGTTQPESFYSHRWPAARQAGRCCGQQPDISQCGAGRSCAVAWKLNPLSILKIPLVR